MQNDFVALWNHIVTSSIYKTTYLWFHREKTDSRNFAFFKQGFIFRTFDILDCWIFLLFQEVSTVKASYSKPIQLFSTAHSCSEKKKDNNFASSKRDCHFSKNLTGIITELTFRKRVALWKYYIQRQVNFVAQIIIAYKKKLIRFRELNQNVLHCIFKTIATLLHRLLLFRKNRWQSSQSKRARNQQKKKKIH